MQMTRRKRKRNRTMFGTCWLALRMALSLIETDEYEDLLGHQHQFLENLSGRKISSSNKLWFDTPAAEAATAAGASVATASAAAAAIGTIATGAATSTATAATNAGPVENPVENPGLNIVGDADAMDGASHVQKLRHWTQKIKEMQGTSVEMRSKNPMVKWRIIADVDPPMMHGPA
jgi:hypothetical protein